MRRAATTILTICLPFISACQSNEPKSGESNKDEVRLQGLWKVVRAEMSGKPVPERRIREFSPALLFEGDHVLMNPPVLVDPQFKVNPDTVPKTIDLHDSKKQIRGIYKFDGADLVLCYSLAGSRPKEFKTTKKEKSHLWVLQRVSIKTAPRPKTDKAALQGAWHVAKAEQAGQVIPRDKQIRGLSMLLVQSNQLIIMGELGISDITEITLDPTKNPKTIDLKREDKKGAQLGIYKLGSGGYQLSLCIAKSQKPRPTDFTTSPKDQHMLLVLLRHLWPQKR